MSSFKKLTQSLHRMRMSVRSWLRNYSMVLFPSAIVLPVYYRRMHILQSRIRGLAWVLAIGTPLWSIPELFVFPTDTWRSLLVARLIAGAAFASFLLIGRIVMKEGTRNLWLIYAQLLFIFAVPTFFYLYCHNPLHLATSGQPIGDALARSYYLLPLIILSCIGLFPLTIIEALGTGMFLLTAFYEVGRKSSIDIGMDWIMALTMAIAVVISVSHLRMLITMVNFSSYDALTDCLGRRSGEEITRSLWHYAVRRKAPFAVAFVDLDHFKLVNDCFGHQVGDAVLANTAAAIKRSLRRSDFVIRWGGEEFLIVMPDVSMENALSLLTRMAENGFGTRPDGSVQTVSIGIAERMNDNADDESMLIQMADERLYQAKIAGRHRAVGAKVVVLQ